MDSDEVEVGNLRASVSLPAVKSQLAFPVPVDQDATLSPSASFGASGGLQTDSFEHSRSAVDDMGAPWRGVPAPLHTGYYGGGYYARPQGLRGYGPGMTPFGPTEVVGARSTSTVQVRTHSHRPTIDHLVDPATHTETVHS
jgi:hypothetical protein